MPGQTHDIGRRKLRASRVVDPTEIATWRNAKKAERT